MMSEGDLQITIIRVEFAFQKPVCVCILGIASSLPSRMGNHIVQAYMCPEQTPKGTS